MKRLLLFCAISTSIVTCLDKPAGLLFGEMEEGVGWNRGPALALASFDGSEGTYQNAVATQGNGNHFEVDFTFNGRDGSAPTAALI